MAQWHTSKTPQENHGGRNSKRNILVHSDEQGFASPLTEFELARHSHKGNKWVPYTVTVMLM